jgi:hypothetical protein
MNMSENMKHLQSRGEIFVGRCGVYILYCQPKDIFGNKGLFEVQKNVRTVKDFGNMASKMTEKHSVFQYIYSFQKKKDAIRFIVKEEALDFDAEQKFIDFINTKKTRENYESTNS